MTQNIPVTSPPVQLTKNQRYSGIGARPMREIISGRDAQNERGMRMTLAYAIDNEEGFTKLDANTQALYTKQDNGSYLLNVDGAVAKSKADELEQKLAEAQKALLGPDGKAWQDMFNGSQEANKKIRSERDGFENELKGWKAFGSIEDVKKLKDEIDGFKAKGAKLDEAQQEIVNLKQGKRELEAQVSSLSSKTLDLEKVNKELLDYKTQAEKKADLYDADQKITAAVEAIPEANKKALRRNLMDRYKDGDLIRDAKGELISKDDALTLGQYAKEQMEAYGLVARSESGHHIPDGAKTAPPSTSTYGDIASLLK